MMWCQIDRQLTRTVESLYPRLSEFAVRHLWNVPFTTARYLSHHELKTIIMSYLQSPDELSQKKRFELVVLVILVLIEFDGDNEAKQLTSRRGKECITGVGPINV